MLHNEPEQRESLENNQAKQPNSMPKKLLSSLLTSMSKRLESSWLTNLFKC